MVKNYIITTIESNLFISAETKDNFFVLAMRYR